MNLVKYRTELGMSQQQLAQRSVVAIDHIQDIEAGRIRTRNIREAVAMRLAIALHVTVDDLMEAVVLDDGRLIYMDEFQWFTPIRPEE